MELIWPVVLILLELVCGQYFDRMVNIRHSKSRARLFRGHREEDYATQAVLYPSLTEKLRSVENPLYSDNFSNVNLEPLKSAASSPNNTKPKKSRKVTVDPTTNSSWQHVDKSVMFMGERALNTIGNKRKNRTKTINTEDAVKETFVEDDLDDEIETSHKRDGVETGHIDIVTRFLRIVESQHLLGENCTAGTDLNLGEGVVDRYAQERFRVEADVAVNRANMLTRLWKYADPSVMMSEYLLHASVFSMVEFDDDIFAAGNCYDQYQYKDYWLFCPYAYRLPEGTILVKDLAVEYKYLSNTSEWFYIARKNAENVIKNYNQFSRGKVSLCNA